MMKGSLLLGIVAGLVMLAVGCSGYGTPGGNTTSATTTQASGNGVVISGFAFSPPTLIVAVGTKVTWTNKDTATHTVTSDTGVFDSGNLANGASYSYTFGTAGTFPYHCSIHTYMKGTVIVQ